MSIGSLPHTFDAIHPIDLTFGTYNELSLYFQLIKATWCLIFCSFFAVLFNPRVQFLMLVES